MVATAIQVRTLTAEGAGKQRPQIQSTKKKKWVKIFKKQMR